MEINSSPCRLRRGPAEALGLKDQDGCLGTPQLPVPGGAGRAPARSKLRCRGTGGQSSLHPLPSVPPQQPLHAVNPPVGMC